MICSLKIFLSLFKSIYHRNATKNYTMKQIHTPTGHPQVSYIKINLDVMSIEEVIPMQETVTRKISGPVRKIFQGEAKRAVQAVLHTSALVEGTILVIDADNALAL